MRYKMNYVNFMFVCYSIVGLLMIFEVSARREHTIKDDKADSPKVKNMVYKYLPLCNYVYKTVHNYNLQCNCL